MRTQLRISYGGYSYLKVESDTDSSTYLLEKFIAEKKLVVQDISIEKSIGNIIKIHGTCHEDKPDAALGCFSIIFEVVSNDDAENLTRLEDFLLEKLGEL